MAPRKPAEDTVTEDPTAGEVTVQDGQTAAEADADAVNVAIPSGLEDGPVTFTRPGIEARDFTVKDGKISTTKEGRAWLLQHVAGTSPAAD
jgi:hypothetical protein